MKRFVVIVLAVAGIAAAQSHRWAYRYNGPHGTGSNTDVHAMCETSDGVLLCGTGLNGTNQGALLVEVASNGSESWVGFLDSVLPYAMCRAQGGGAIVAGARLARNLDWYNDATIVGVTVGAGEAWRYDFDYSSPYSSEEVDYVTQAPGGNIYALGYANNSLCFWALNSSGGLLDREELQGPDSVNLLPAAICCSPSNDVYFAGTYLHNGYFNILVAKYVPGGGGWVTLFDGYGLDNSVAQMTVNPAGGVIVVGLTHSDNQTTKLMALNLSELNGDVVWSRAYSYAGLTDQARAVACDPQGNVYITGGSADSTTGTGFLVLSLTNTDSLRWVDRYSGPNASDDYGMAIDFDHDGNVIAMGNSKSSSYNWDFCAVSLTPSGTRRWAHRYDAGDNEWVNCGLVAGDSNVYIGGTGIVTGYQTQMLLESVDPATGIAEAPPARPKLELLSSPVVRNGVMRFELSAPARLAVYDASGARRMSWSSSGGLETRDVSGLAAGTYVLTAKTRGGRASRKAVLTR